MTTAPREPTPSALQDFGAVLDMDGTLVNTEHVWFEAGCDLMLDLDIDLPDAALDELHGLDLDAVPRLLPEDYGLRLTREDYVARLLAAVEPGSRPSRIPSLPSAMSSERAGSRAVADPATDEAINPVHGRGVAHQHSERDVHNDWPAPVSSTRDYRAFGRTHPSRPRCTRLRTEAYRRRDGTGVDARLDDTQFESAMEEGLVIN